MVNCFSELLTNNFFVVFYFNHWGSKVKKYLIFNTLRKTSWCERCIKKNNWHINETVVKYKTSELHWGWRETGNSNKSKQAMKGFDVISRNLDTILQGMENSPLRNNKLITFFILILQCLWREKPAYLHTYPQASQLSEPCITSFLKVTFLIIWSRSDPLLHKFQILPCTNIY